MVSSYPVTFDVDYPARPLDRLTSGLRIFVAIPILIVLALMPMDTYHSSSQTTMSNMSIGGGLVFVPLVLMIVFRQKYPRWWFDFNLNVLRFSSRVLVYCALLDDRYPSTDEEQAVHLDFPYPDAAQLNRWLPLVKWLLAIPHYFVLIFLAFAAFGAIIGAWFVILFTGSYPRSLFDFVVGVFRWANRVNGYAFALVTDQYPPFRLS
jgi:hypothetical protein